jgi:DNA-binding transcriptional regulator GbsR (MarR family)
MRPEGQRDEEAVRRFVEHFAMSFVEFGFPRMASRVLGVLLTTDEPGVTATEIGERLGVSAGAVSGAVRFLVHVNLIAREPVPGSRRDLYKVPEDSWANLVQAGYYKRFADMVHEGVLAVGGESSPSGERMADMRDFLMYVHEEMTTVFHKWWEARRAQRAAERTEL